jgi:tRNA dimethylallyltransferase
MGKSARQALGYKEVIDHLEGRMALSETINFIQTRTRQFAKRQHTWFRNLAECNALKVSGSESPCEISERLVHVGQPAHPDGQ